jgi:hypothetical protein
LAKILNHLTNTSINRYVSDLSEAIIVEFQEHFMNLEISKIIEITFETYGMFTSLMHLSTQRKSWNEVLKVTLYQYIKSLLTTGSKKVKSKEELLKKLENDKNSLQSAYEQILGENSTKDTLKIIEEFIDFLDCSCEMIGICCSRLREYNGDSFTINTAKALINLRTDMSKSEKNEAISSCKEVLDNFISSNKSNENAIIFANMNKEINEENEDNEEDMEEITENRRKTVNLIDFLNIEMDKDDLDDDKKDEDYNSNNMNIIIKKNDAIVDSDVIISGMMMKKSHNS